MSEIQIKISRNLILYSIWTLKLENVRDSTKNIKESYTIFNVNSETRKYWSFNFKISRNHIRYLMWIRETRKYRSFNQKYQRIVSDIYCELVKLENIGLQLKISRDRIRYLTMNLYQNQGYIMVILGTVS